MFSPTLRLPILRTGLRKAGAQDRLLKIRKDFQFGVCLPTGRQACKATTHSRTVGNNMKIKIVHIFLFLSFSTIKAQKVLVDSTLVVEKTLIKSSSHNVINQKAFILKGEVFNSVQKHYFDGDTLKLVFARSGLAGQALLISISDTVKTKIGLWSDYPAFGGKYSKSLELEFSEVVINQMELEQTDTLMIKLKCRSVSFDGYGGNPKFEYSGTIKHVLELE